VSTSAALIEFANYDHHFFSNPVPHHVGVLRKVGHQFSTTMVATRGRIIVYMCIA